MVDERAGIHLNAEQHDASVIVIEKTPRAAGRARGLVEVVSAKQRIDQTAAPGNRMSRVQTAMGGESDTKQFSKDSDNRGCQDFVEDRIGRINCSP